MKMMLAENVRRFRKERGLTQEQLSEVLGVTAGAVYKWEASLSVPDLDLILEMADFFDVSVDVLLGYEMKDNRLDATVKRLQEYRRNKDRAGLAEAEKALKKYPHSFTVVHECARLYGGFGFEAGDRELLRRALELQERSRLLLSQNTDPKISEQTVCGQMALTYLALEKTDRALELFKANNAGGLYNHRIGQMLASCGRTEEALPYLSEALTGIIAGLIGTVIGYGNVYGACDDHASVQAILRLGIGFLSGLREENKPNYLDKISSGLLAALAGSQFLCGQNEAARDSLEQAKNLAALFDASPNYDENSIRFISRIEGTGAYDDIGATAEEAVNNVVSGFENEAFTAFWNGIREQKEHTENE